MRRPQLIALVFTTAIFLGGGLYLFAAQVQLEWKSITEKWTDSNSPVSADLMERKTNSTKPKSNSIGKVIDTYKGVKVYNNGRVRNVSGRNVTKDGYNLGLKYQCVEFVKRFYYEYFDHKMPNSYGHAKDFFNHAVADGALNKERGLYQYANGGVAKPSVNSLVIFGPTPYNSFGHVAIISKVTKAYIEIVQQNAGSNVPTREKLALSFNDGRWTIEDQYLMGWLSK